MYLFYSIGFLIASLIQAGIVALAQLFNISDFNVKTSLMQFIVHLIVGQVAGYLILFAMRNISFTNRINPIISGVIWGIIFYIIIIPINTMLGRIEAPWTAGIATVLTGLNAFMIFGIACVYTIKIVGVKKKAIN